MTRALGVLALLMALACHKESRLQSSNESATAPSAHEASDAATEGAAGAGRPAVVPARCRATERRLAIESSGDVEIGDALVLPGGLAVSLVHATSMGRVAAVGLLPADLSRLTLVDLAPTLGDAPPPRLAWRGRDLLAVDYVLPRKAARSTGSRDLAVWAIEDPFGAGAPKDKPEAAGAPKDKPEAAGAPKDKPAEKTGTATAPRDPLSYVSQQRDDSLAFDLAQSSGNSLLVWDESAATPRSGGASPHGVIRAASLTATGVDPTRDVSPPESDAEMARVVPNGSGFFVVWLARRPDPANGPAQEAAVEALGEARAFGWLEMVAVDARGAPVGLVRRLTPQTGHVTAYDVQSLAGAGEPKRALLVVARDDGETVDGAGGSMLRVKATEDTAEPPLELPTDGLGRGAPSFVDAAFGSRSPWLAWVAPHEQMRLLPLDLAGVPVAPPSAEDGLSEARPLLALPHDQMLVATQPPSGEVSVPPNLGTALTAFLCTR